MGKFRRNFEESVENDLLTSDFGNRFLERFELLDKIHESKLNQIFIIKDKNSDKFLILKAISKDSEYIYDLDSIKKISHENVVRIFDIQETDRYIYLIKEYIKGTTLEQQIHASGPISENDAVGIAIIVCDILEYFHSREPQPLVYRDLKPANLIVTDSGRVKLIDLDSIREFKSNSENDTFYVGTAGFASPEQFGFSQTDARSDIFTLGATIFYLVTGQIPITDRIRAKNAQKGFHISEGLMSIIEKSTRFNPDKRYQTAAELRQELENLKRPKPAFFSFKIAKSFAESKVVRVFAFIVILVIIAYPVFGMLSNYLDKPQTDTKTKQQKQLLSANGKTAITESALGVAKTTLSVSKTQMLPDIKTDQGKPLQPTIGALIQTPKSVQPQTTLVRSTSAHQVVQSKGPAIASQSGNKTAVIAKSVTPTIVQIDLSKDHSPEITQAPTEAPTVEPEATPVPTRKPTYSGNGTFSFDKTTVSEAFWSGTMPQKQDSDFCDYFIQGSGYKYRDSEFYIAINNWDSSRDYTQMAERIRKVGGNLVLRADGYKEVPVQVTYSSIVVPDSGYAYAVKLLDAASFASNIKYKLVDESGHWVIDSDVIVIRPSK